MFAPTGAPAAGAGHNSAFREKLFLSHPLSVNSALARTTCVISPACPTRFEALFSARHVRSKRSRRAADLWEGNRVRSELVVGTLFEIEKRVLHGAQINDSSNNRGKEKFSASKLGCWLRCFVRVRSHFFYKTVFIKHGNSVLNITNISRSRDLPLLNLYTQQEIFD